MADLRKFKVIVTQEVEVTLDAESFDDAFIAEFTDTQYPYFDLEDHAKHIAQLRARGVFDGYASVFVEGYGVAGEMGIAAKVTDIFEEVEATS